MLEGKKSLILVATFFVMTAMFAVVIAKSLSSNDAEDILKMSDKSSVLPASQVPPPIQVTNADSSAMEADAPPASLPSETDPTDPEADPTEEDAEEEEKQTYTSDLLKISFKYTGDLEIKEGISNVTVKDEDNSWKMKFYENKKKVNLEKWFKDKYEKDNDNCRFDSAQITIGEYEGKHVVVEDAGAEETDSPECDDTGHYAISSDKTRVVKVEPGETPIETINTLLADFEFNEEST